MPSSPECLCSQAFFNLCTGYLVLLGGRGAGLFDFSLSIVEFALAGVPGALGAGLGTIDGAGLGTGAGLGIGAGLGAELGVGFKELTLPVLEGRTDSSPLVARGAGLTEVTTRSDTCD